MDEFERRGIGSGTHQKGWRKQKRVSIHVGRSTVFAYASNESVSLLYTTVDPLDASSLLELEHYIMWMF